MSLQEVKGVVLFNRRHRERDYLVKIFTDQFGKLMFFVRGSKKNRLSLEQAIQPFANATYIVDIRSQGLSFLRDTKELNVMNHIYGDLFKQAYATYLTNLADAALEDRVVNPSLMMELKSALEAINAGKDPESITNIYEIHMMRWFGVEQKWDACVICGEQEGAFDYSSKYNGLLCNRHWYLDERRYHLTPRTLYFIRLFSRTSFSQIADISVGEETKKELRAFIDSLYEENVGLHLKSKSFIDHMHDFENLHVDWSKRKKDKDEKDASR